MEVLKKALPFIVFNKFQVVQIDYYSHLLFFSSWKLMESDEIPKKLWKSFQFYSRLLLIIIWKESVKTACLLKTGFTYQIGFFHPDHVIEHSIQKQPKFKQIISKYCFTIKVQWLA